MVQSLFRAPLSFSIRWLNRLFHVIECAISHDDQEPIIYVPVFIIGAPRSGSTLLYQAMTEQYDFGYLSNLHCRFYGAPSLIERLLNPLKSRQPSSYTSNFGWTQGKAAPSECGEYWYRFFRRKPQYVPLEEADPPKLRQLRASVRALGNAFGKPILFKNMNCALRLMPTAQALPEALFIVTHRNIIDNACSLLKVRQQVYGDYIHWWSMEPPTVEQLKGLSPHEQVIEQIRHIDNLIETQSQIIGRDRFIHIQYEQFCDDVHGTLSKFDRFFAHHDVDIKRRDVEVPGHFERREKVPVESKLYQQVVQYAHND